MENNMRPIKQKNTKIIVELVYFFWHNASTCNWQKINVVEFIALEEQLVTVGKTLEINCFIMFYKLDRMAMLK